MTAPSPLLFSKSQLFRLIWPLVIEQLLLELVGMVDVVMVASLGEAAVSGVSLVDSINQLLIQFLAALAAGGTVVCSQFLGKRDGQNANRSVGQLLSLSVFAASLLSIVFLLSGRSMLRLIFGSVEDAVMDNAAIYFRLTACSFPFLALYNSCAALFRAMGNSRTPMNTSLFMNGLNIVGNAICIFGLKMGVLGVAVPTLISRIAASVLIFSLLQKPGNQIRLLDLRDLIPQKTLILRILGIGIPGGIENSLFQLGKLMLQSLVSTLGTASIAGFAVASNLVAFLYLPGHALQFALTAVVGQCVGARESRQASMYVREFMLINYVFLAFMASAMLLGRYPLAGIYQLSPEATEIAAGLIFSHCLAMVVWPPAFVPPHALRAAGDARFTMVVSIFSVWTFRVALAYLFVKGFGGSIHFIWYAMYIDWVFRAIVNLLRLRGFARRIDALSI